MIEQHLFCVVIESIYSEVSLGYFRDIVDVGFLRENIVQNCYFLLVKLYLIRVMLNGHIDAGLYSFIFSSEEIIALLLTIEQIVLHSWLGNHLVFAIRKEF